MPIKNRTIQSPYFSGSDEISVQYKNGMISALNDLSKIVSGREIEDLVSKKMQLFSGSFNETQYLQAACELVICAYFARQYGNSFHYELKVNPPKDVDCAFVDDGIQYNIEIKCPDFSKSNQINSADGYKIGFLGRNPDVGGVINDLTRAFEEAAGGKQLIKQQHMDNKLKDYLLSAHGKFHPQAREDHLNVLVVCCDTPLDAQKWFGYMYENQGLFTRESFHNPNEYNLVDVVLLTNLYHRHFEYIKKDAIADNWLLERAFNLIFSNPLRALDKRSSIYRFAEIVPNYSNALSAYQVPGDAEDYVKNSIRIPSFVGEKLQGSGLFQLHPNSSGVA